MRQWSIALSLLLAATSGLDADGPSHYYRDVPFVQDHSEKVPLAPGLRGTKLRKVRADRNGRIVVLSERGLLSPYAGQLKQSRLHRPLADMDIRDVTVHDGQFVYLTDKRVLSNAWAGRLLVAHGLAGANRLAMARGFDFAAASDDNVTFVQGKERIWTMQGDIRQVAFAGAHDRFLVLADGKLWTVAPTGEKKVAFAREGMNCFAVADRGTTVLVGTAEGCLPLDGDTLEPKAGMQTKLPWPDIRCIEPIGQKLWCGTLRGAFAIHADERIDYYASGRWLVDGAVVDICPGPDGSVLILSERGLSIIHFKQMTLADKAAHFDRLTRQRHIRYGFNSAFVMSEPGDLSTGTLIDQDNDGLWTAMYLAGECFRYAVTKSPEALRNCYESFEAMERLTEITPMEGFPARSFDRAGYQVADKSRWQPAEDERWVWKATTSSDEIVGHFFVYAIFAETVPDPAWRDRAIALMDAIMAHIVRHDWYLVDYDGNPTQWGRWHPEYVNQFPRQVGDRRLNSIEIIAFLQTAYRFTGKEIYRAKAFELFDEHGYLDNIMIPIAEIGRVPGIDLSTEWNHSDDELAFLSYWNLYRYAFDDDLREKYRRAIRGHWQIERPEKNALWDFIYASTGAEDFDLDESVRTLKEMPLDNISWTIRNSHRRDLEFLGPNFRKQTTREVVPPDERPIRKHNANAFDLDGGNGGRREFSGDIYLLPYWLGRYLGVIR